MKHVLAVFLVSLFLGASGFAQERDTANTTTNSGTERPQPASQGTPSAARDAAGGAATEESIEPVDLGTIVVGAAPYGVSLRDLPYNIDVISRRSIEDSGAVSIADAMKNTVGLIVQDLGGYNALKSIRLRGGASNQTAILINGVKIVNDFSNSAYLTQFGAELFENIEIMRGNGSVLYGLGSNFGVVNFTTRQIKQGTHVTMGTVFAGGGLEGFFKGYATSSYGNKNFRILGSFSYLEQGGMRMAKIDDSLIGTLDNRTRENSDATISNVMFTTGYTTDSKKFYVDFTGIVTKHSYGASGSDQYPDTDNRFLKRDYIFILNTGYKLGELIELKLKSFLNYTKYEDMNITTSTSYDIFRYQRPGFELQGIIRPFKKFTAVVGVGNEWQRFHKDAVVNPWGAPEDIGPLTARIFSAFAHFDYSISIVQFMGGVRVDHHSSSNTDKLASFGTLLSVQAGALVTIIGDTLKARVQVSRSNDIPSLLDTSWPGYESSNLASAKYMVYEGGLQSKIGKLLFAKVTGYYYRYWDVKSGSFGSYTNEGKESSKGLELDITITPLANMNLPFQLKIPLNLWIQKTKNLRDKVIIRTRKPKFMVNAGIEGIFKFGLTVGLYAQYRENYDQNAALTENYKDYYLKYFIMDFKVSYRFKAFKADFKVFAQILNLTNTHYAIDGVNSYSFGTTSHTTYTMPGRTIMGGLEVKF